MADELWGYIATTESKDLGIEARRHRYQRRWYDSALVALSDGEMLVRTFMYACEKAANETELEALKTAAVAFKDGAKTVATADEPAEPTHEVLKTFKEVIVGVMATNEVNPPTWLKEADADGTPKQAVWTAGLTVVPEEYIRKVIGESANAVDVDGKSMSEVDKDDQEEEEKDDSEEGDKDGKGKKKVIAKGKKRPAQMLHETLS